MTAPEPGRAQRPTLHFTPLHHWLNDPHGICWAQGTYHLFYQHNPAGRDWAPEIVWGHAISPDLLHWQHQPVALTPYSGEIGCWSGSTLVEDDRPTIFYTSVVADDLGHGRIAIARPDDTLQRWTSTPADIVIPGPPPHLAVHSFRDPCLVKVDDGWAMVVGVGVDSGEGLAVQYLSADGRHWTYDGLLCTRPSNRDDDPWAGSMWECPQLFRVGDDWVLVVSAWDNHQLLHCVAAVGSYDGHTFVPRRWSRLTHDTISYAMTSFSDRDGRPSVMFWIREDPEQDPAEKPWTGAESLPMVVSINPDDTARLDPHPNLTSAHGLPVAVHGSGFVTGALDGLDVAFSVSPGELLELELRQQPGTALEIAVDGSRDTVRITHAGGTTTEIPRHGADVRAVIDAGLVTVFAGEGCATFRYPSHQPADLFLSGNSFNVKIHRLTPAPAGGRDVPPPAAGPSTGATTNGNNADSPQPTRT